MSEEKTFTLPDPQFEADIYYLTKQEGGRQTAVGTGYRGQLYYEGKNWDAGQQFLDKPFCNPGETVKVLMQIASPNDHIGKLFVGKRFEIREGATVVGQGIITNLLFKDFQRRDYANYEKQFIQLILGSKEFEIRDVYNLDCMKGLIFNQEEYSLNVSLIKEGKWYLIKDTKRKIQGKDLHEYLNIVTFSDELGSTYVATIYDSDDLWQDPKLIDLFSIQK